MGMAPLFTSAPRIVLSINDTTIAYAIGLNVSVSVSLQPIKVISKFGALTWEPTMYNVVTGTLQIIRLNSSADQSAKIIAANALLNSNTFNGVQGATVAGITAAGGAQITKEVGVNDFADSNSVLAANHLYSHLDPSKVLVSQTFSLNMFLKVPTVAAATAAVAASAATATSAAVAAKEANPTPLGQTATASWMRIEDCRLSGRNTNLALGQLVNEPLSFQGLLLTSMTEGAANFLRDAGVTQVS